MSRYVIPIPGPGGCCFILNEEGSVTGDSRLPMPEVVAVHLGPSATINEYVGYLRRNGRSRGELERNVEEFIEMTENETGVVAELDDATPMDERGSSSRGSRRGYDQPPSSRSGYYAQFSSYGRPPSSQSHPGSSYGRSSRPFPRGQPCPLRRESRLAYPCPSHRYDDDEEDDNDDEDEDDRYPSGYGRSYGSGPSSGCRQGSHSGLMNLGGGASISRSSGGRGGYEDSDDDEDEYEEDYGYRPSHNRFSSGRSSGRPSSSRWDRFH